MNVLRKAVVGVGIAAAAISAVAVAAPAANAATNKSLVVFAHSYVRSLAVTQYVCTGAVCLANPAKCVTIPARTAASWVTVPGITLTPGNQVEVEAYRSAKCDSTATQSSPIVDVPKDDSREFRVNLD